MPGARDAKKETSTRLQELIVQRKAATQVQREGQCGRRAARQAGVSGPPRRNWRKCMKKDEDEGTSERRFWQERGAFQEAASRHPIWRAAWVSGRWRCADGTQVWVAGR